MTLPRWDADDEALMAELAAAVADSRQVPARFAGAARAAFSWRSVDEELELLTLCFDSAHEGAFVRGSRDTAPRILAFEGSQLGVEVEITGDHLVGQLLPPQRGRVWLSTPQGETLEASADESGCFLLTHPPAGPLRLRCETARASFVTEWMPI